MRYKFRSWAAEAQALEDVRIFELQLAHAREPIVLALERRFRHYLRTAMFFAVQRIFDRSPAAALSYSFAALINSRALARFDPAHRAFRALNLLGRDALLRISNVVVFLQYFIPIANPCTCKSGNSFLSRCPMSIRQNGPFGIFNSFSTPYAFERAWRTVSPVPQAMRI